MIVDNKLAAIKSMQEGQYRYDLFKKLAFNFEQGKSILDIGCGPGFNSIILDQVYKLKVFATDIYEHDNIRRHKIAFKKASILNLPYKSHSFDYVFLHDVLHHIDEPKQRRNLHINALLEIKRLVTKNGYIIILEANRYNPLFYPHMVKIKKHDHFNQRYFVALIKGVFPKTRMKFIEVHYYNSRIPKFWALYEKVAEKFFPDILKAYNVAIIKAYS